MPYKDKKKQKKYVRDYMQDQRTILEILKKEHPETYKAIIGELQERKRRGRRGRG